MFIPSLIKDDLYELADNYCCGSNIYRHEVVPAIIDFFRKNPEIQSDWYDYDCETFECGVFYVAWIEEGRLFTEAFTWRL